ncbi:lipocalin family protein [Caballeronia concitans]|uniref:Outer membrane lipoprotein Blc n=1 Tax=Caballeronia concitans TaxID=1777133 RepID=A0A658R0D9_9BURK|nr:lipocalin family protein [Caballeronia concitans]KIG10133.1 Lipocalin/cytosolic fatty-acid binding protein domain containing protein [Burkholderia sp. MR1]SAL37079.1 Lipocalin family protein [Caballeronia concitans]
MKLKRPWTYGATALVLLGGIGALAAYASQSAKQRGNDHVPKPSKAVDLDRYLGHWFEFARYENRFERNCEAATANYARREDGLISVINACRQGSLSGPYRAAEGRAKVVAGSNGTKLKVSFFGPFYVGDYWILDHADDYTWSIVGEPSGRYLWILTREARPSAELRRTLLARASALGYDVTMLRETQHG